MGNRIIKESICTSDSIDKLTWFEECFFYRLMVSVDDFGIFDGRISIIKSRLFPLRNNVTDKQIDDALNKLASVGILSRKTYVQKPYLQITAWAEHQQIRSKKSKHVPIDDDGNPIFDNSYEQLKSLDINCNQMIAQSNPIQSEYNPNTNTNTILCDRFEEFWNLYPKKVSKKDAQKAWKKIKQANLDAIFIALEKQKHSQGWQKDNGKYIPNPATWINGERWLDELGGEVIAGAGNTNAVAGKAEHKPKYGKTV